ncbi:MAG: methyltransferase domain-containing protein [Deltaproteobacteria bacterium]|nr:methyltransferase domain-containing protein [Deltaproteobacteria bacterium]
MSEPFSWTNREFDQYAAEYDAALDRGLSLSGEDKTYFAEGRIAWLAELLKQLGERPRHCLDFGCGIGSAAPLLFSLLNANRVTGVDVSPASLAFARRITASDRAQFLQLDEYHPREEIDLAFCNGVFHHIPTPERAPAVNYVSRALRPGGLFAFWENNPWNPGTRLVMSRIPFDREAVTVSAPEARRLLITAGFEVLRIDFLFIFPKMLRQLRFIEPWVTRLPLGGQYQVLCRKPDR